LVPTSRRPGQTPKRLVALLCMDPDRVEKVTEYPPALLHTLVNLSPLDHLLQTFTASIDLPHDFYTDLSKAINRNDSLRSSDPHGDPHEELSKAEKGNSSITTSTGVQGEGKRT
jgi:hypothetical protein